MHAKMMAGLFRYWVAAGIVGVVVCFNIIFSSVRLELVTGTSNVEAAGSSTTSAITATSSATTTTTGKKETEEVQELTTTDAAGAAGSLSTTTSSSSAITTATSSITTTATGDRVKGDLEEVEVRLLNKEDQNKEKAALQEEVLQARHNKLSVSSQNEGKQVDIETAANPRRRILHFSDPEEILRTEIAGNTQFVMVFVNQQSLSLFGVWLYWYKKSQDNNNRPKTLLIFGIDGTDAVELIKEALVPSRIELFLPENTNIILSPVPDIQFTAQGKGKEPKGDLSKGQRKKIWAARVKILGQLMHAFPSNDIVVSDLDAIWMKDPDSIHLFDRHPNADVLLGRGKMACNLLINWDDGIKSHYEVQTGCFGFVLFRNTQATQELLENHMLSSIGEYIWDDQVTFNCVLTDQYHRIEQSQKGTTDDSQQLANDGILSTSWPDKTIIQRYIPRSSKDEYYHSPKSNSKTRTSDSISIISRDDPRLQPQQSTAPLTVVIVPERLIRRTGCKKDVQEIHDNAIVAHCFSTDKNHFFRKMKFIPPPNNTDMLLFPPKDDERRTI